MVEEPATEKIVNRFQDAHIIVTGGAGFIGSHLTERLVEYGANILVIDDLSRGNLKNLDPVKDDIQMRIGSISDAELVQQTVAEHEPEIVFHLAAQNLVLSIQDPRSDAQVTIMGLLNLLDAIQKTGQTEVFVHSSTGSVYGEPLKTPQTEEHPRVPTSPYGVSKLAAEEYLRVWNDLYSLPYVSLRYYNVYGPRQSANESTGGGVIPVFANRLLAGEPLIIEGTGEQQRCFTFVGDVVRANILSVVNKACWNDVYNIATDEHTDILSLADIMMDVSDITTEIEYAPPRPGDIMRFDPSISHAEEKMGYVPRVRLREGLADYIQWLRSMKK